MNKWDILHLGALYGFFGALYLFILGWGIYTLL